MTLTYNDWHLPEDRSICKETAQKFLKRLRYHLKRKMRYYMVGEYGSDFMRPHYHAILFGVGLNERDPLYKSWMDEDGEEIGFVSVSGVGPESARYVSGYVIKGWNRKDCEKLKGRQPEFSIMSR